MRSRDEEHTYSLQGPSNTKARPLLLPTTLGNSTRTFLSVILTVNLDIRLSYLLGRLATSHPLLALNPMTLLGRANGRPEPEVIVQVRYLPHIRSFMTISIRRIRWLPGANALAI